MTIGLATNLLIVYMISATTDHWATLVGTFSFFLTETLKKYSALLMTVAVQLLNGTKSKNSTKNSSCGETLETLTHMAKTYGQFAA